MQKQSSIRTQLSATFVLLSILCITLVGLPLYWLAQSLLSSALQDKLESSVELSVLSLPAEEIFALVPGDEQSEHYSKIVAGLAELKEEADLEDTFIVDKQGKLLASMHPEEKIGNDSARVTQDKINIPQALYQDVTFSDLYQDSLGEPYQAAYAPIDGKALLVVIVPATYLEQLTSFSRLFGLAGLVLLIVMSLVGSLSAGWVTRPLRRLVIAVGKLEQGGRLEPLPPARSLELKALQDEFQKMALAVEQREAWLRALAGSVAHEVRNPTNALRLHLGLLKRSLSRNHTIEELLPRFTMLESDLELLEETVSHFLTFANRGEVQRRPIMLRSLLQRAFDGEVDAPEVEVMLDPILTERALGNLIRNARQAGATELRVKASVEEKTVHIYAEDNGAGFPIELREKAFEPFITGRVEGSGIGLAVVAAICRAHGGEARIVKAGPNGTVVELVLRS
jgi:signal transduction histidine kinase